MLVCHYKQHNTAENVKRKTKTIATTDTRIVRCSKKNPRRGSNEIRWEISARTIRHRLNEAQLFGKVGG